MNYHRGDEVLDAGPDRAPAPMAGRLLRLMRKELNEILRDRRTILTMLFMPLVLYPLLSIAFQQFLLASALPKMSNDQLIRMGFLDKAHDAAFQQLLGTVDDLPLEIKQKLYKLDKGFAESLIEPQMNQLFAKLFEREIDVAIVPAGRFSPGASGGIIEWQILYREDSQRSQKVYHLIAERIAIVNTDIVFARPEGKKALQGQPVFLATGKAMSLPKPPEEIPLGSLIPLILILMTITGAVYPAIDLTAGERERGTLEILVAAPVPRLGLLFAKYVAVVTIAILTALVNLLSMTLTVVVTGLGTMLFGEAGLSLALMFQIFGLLLLFAAFFSAVLLTLTSFARSFKEAQAYLIPLMLVSLAPGLAGMIPGLTLTPILSVVPLLNVVLLGRDLFAHAASPVLVTIVISSTLAYAVAAIAVAARLFGSEDVLYSNQSGWAELFRRPMQVRRVASVSNALFCLSVAFSILFVIRGAAQQLWPASPASLSSALPHLLLVPVLSIVLFVGLPVGAALWRRIRLRTGFLLERAPILVYPAALLLGISLWPWVLDLLALFHQNGWTTMTQENSNQVNRTARQLAQIAPLWLLLLVAVVPAITEELFFRGFLFAALRRTTGTATTIIVCALLFGVFHVATEPFGLDRLLPSTLMGLILGWVCWRSGSVVAPMLLHACHNAVLIWILYDNAQPGGGYFTDMEFVPWHWLLVAAAGVLVGSGILWCNKPPRVTSKNTEESLEPPTVEWKPGPT
jgi:ABC-2 type transport system permease protein/sodium transport system permease protein